MKSDYKMTSPARLATIARLADRCPECSTRPVIESRGWGARLTCPACHTTGPWDECPYLASVAWNKEARISIAERINGSPKSSR